MTTLQLDQHDDGFDLSLGGRLVIRHRAATPFAFVGRGTPSIAMFRGNFRIEDYVEARLPLTHVQIAETPNGFEAAFAAAEGQPTALVMTICGSEDDVQLGFKAGAGDFNRLWLRFVSEPGEKLFGGGEQMSYFDLKGRRFPLWTSEPGVGRDKSTLVTFMADQAMAGGDYYTTNYPQPTYVSSRRYALHVETTSYSVFDFRHPEFHEIEVWEIPERIELYVRPTFLQLVEVLSARFGRQPVLPDWILSGAVIGLKDGDNSFARLKLYRDAGTAIAALWCEDWVGVRQTSFGRRLFWDWRWSPARYPDLPNHIAELAAEGVRFMGYVNPYLCVDGSLYPAAAAAGYLALKPDEDAPFIVDFGEFDCGVVDFTNPDAARWFADEVIGANMLDFGLSGWMADFGEYLPHDVRLSSGLPGMLAHNAWPTLWAQVNAEAVAGRGKTGEAVFFMRAGFTGVQAHCPLLWAGDQSVDFSRHDGIGTVICGALSSGLLGNAYHHSDIGGYTSLFGVQRTAELIQRWTEMACFTPVMRTHEGNRPDENLQVDQDAEVLAHFARMTRVHRALLPYLKVLAEEASNTGLPLQRALFLHFEDDPRAYETQSVYLLGPDLLVAPVIEPGRKDWTVYLPAGADWTHLWSGASHSGGSTFKVEAPIGAPPVFWRKGSAFAELFTRIAAL
jgi:sulfoquinovosidase